MEGQKKERRNASVFGILFREIHVGRQAFCAQDPGRRADSGQKQFA